MIIPPEETFIFAWGDDKKNVINTLNDILDFYLNDNGLKYIIAEDVNKCKILFSKRNLTMSMSYCLDDKLVRKCISSQITHGISRSLETTEKSMHNISGVGKYGLEGAIHNLDGACMDLKHTVAEMQRQYTKSKYPIIGILHIRTLKKSIKKLTSQTN